MVIIDDPAIEIVQEPQENAAEGILMQYVGVARKDVRGFVQVGIRPEILEETLANTAIAVVLDEIDYGKKGYVWAVDLQSGLVTAHPEKNLIGTSAKDAGLPVKAGSGRAKVNLVTFPFVDLRLLLPHLQLRQNHCTKDQYTA